MIKAVTQENLCLNLPYDGGARSVVLQLKPEEEVACAVTPRITIMKGTFDQNVWSIQSRVSDVSRSLRDISLTYVNAPLEECENSGKTCRDRNNNIGDLEPDPEVTRRWNLYALVLPAALLSVFVGLTCAVLSDKVHAKAAQRTLLGIGIAALCEAPLAALIGWGLANLGGAM